MKGGPRYLSISNCSDPALATFARPGVPVLAEAAGARLSDATAAKVAARVMARLRRLWFTERAYLA